MFISDPEREFEGWKEEIFRETLAKDMQRNLDRNEPKSLAKKMKLTNNSKTATNASVEFQSSGLDDPCCSKSLGKSLGVSGASKTRKNANASGLPTSDQGDSEFKRFNCGQCPLTFKAYYDMYQHRKTHNCRSDDAISQLKEALQPPNGSSTSSHEEADTKLRAILSKMISEEASKLLAKFKQSLTQQKTVVPLVVPSKPPVEKITLSQEQVTIEPRRSLKRKNTQLEVARSEVLSPTVASIHCKFEGCRKKFPSKSRLTVHCNADHPGQKHYFCDQCPKTFGAASNLRQHGFSHREPTFQCDFCPQKSKTRGGIMRHMKRVHKVLMDI